MTSKRASSKSSASRTFRTNANFAVPFVVFVLYERKWSAGAPGGLMAWAATMARSVVARAITEAPAMRVGFIRFLPGTGS